MVPIAAVACVAALAVVIAALVIRSRAARAVREEIEAKERAVYSFNSAYSGIHVAIEEPLRSMGSSHDDEYLEL